MTRDKIRSVLLDHGFRIPEGMTDLRPYVYEAAEALLAEAGAPTPPAAHNDAGYAAGIQAVATMLERKADTFTEEFGYDDMGSLSFGRGREAEAKADYHQSLLELVDEVRAMLAAAPTPPVQQDDEALELLREIVAAWEMAPGQRKIIRVSRLLDDARALLEKRGEK